MTQQLHFRCVLKRNENMFTQNQIRECLQQQYSKSQTVGTTQMIKCGPHQGTAKL